jgi:membrane peptidoglycan carboxypeptidase
MNTSFHDIMMSSHDLARAWVWSRRATAHPVVGVKLDVRYTPAQILQMYSDAAYFGHRFYGLAAASCGYFGKPPAALSWAQAAILAAITQAPVAEDPFTHPAMARAGEAQVLDRLVAKHTLTSTQASAARGRVIEPAGRLPQTIRRHC